MIPLFADLQTIWSQSIIYCCKTEKRRKKQIQTHSDYKSNNILQTACTHATSRMHILKHWMSMTTFHMQKIAVKYEWHKRYLCGARLMIFFLFSPLFNIFCLHDFHTTSCLKSCAIDGRDNMNSLNIDICLKIICCYFISEVAHSIWSSLAEQKRYV